MGITNIATTKSNSDVNACSKNPKNTKLAVFISNKNSK